MKSYLPNIGERLARWVLAHRALTVVVSIAVTAALGLGALRVQFSTDYRIFFPKSDRKLAAFDKLEKVFTKTDNVMFVVKPREGDIFRSDVLAAIKSLTERAWKLPFAARVDSLTNFQHSRAVGDELKVGALVPGRPSALSAYDLRELRRIVGAEPLLDGSLVARDRKAAGVNVTLQLRRKDPTEVSRAAAAARALAKDIAAQFPTVEVRPSGMAMMNDAFMQASLADMSLTIPLMAIAMLIVLTLLLRGAWPTLSIAAVFGCSAAMTMGLAGWLGYPLTPPSAASPTIVLTLAIADGVHLVVSVLRALGRGVEQRQAIIDSQRENFKAMLLTSLTTAIGFLCLNFAEAPPFWHLANMTALGVVAAFVFSVTLLPVLLSLVRLRAPRTRESDAPEKRRIAPAVAAWVLRQRRPILAAGLVAALLFTALAARLRSNDHFVGYFASSLSFRRDTDFMVKHLAGLYTVEYQLGSGAKNGITKPRYLAQVDAFVRWLRAQHEVSHVYSITDVLKRLRMNSYDDDRSEYKLPAKRAVASQLLLLYEMSLPQGLDLTDRVDLDKSRSRVTVTLTNLSSRDLRAFTARSKAWLRRNADAPLWTQPISPVVIFSSLSDRNTRAMMRGNILSLLLISALLALALRSVRLGALSVLPNLIPFALAYGVWQLLFGEVNIVASISGAVGLGIIVDDTIHFLARYQRKRAEGLEPTEAARQTFSEISAALCSTTIVLSIGFAVLLLSSFQMTSHLGLLTILILGAALAADLLLLPALLATFDRKRPARAPSHALETRAPTHKTQVGEA
ncbi:MAG: MMPL family transporter [Myxococcales bacterium]|nr:MMPL family transporter [Myxococcales bacterium]